MAIAIGKRGAVATVRIAPVERWCCYYEHGKNTDAGRKMVGFEIQIDPQSMRPAKCAPNAKMWTATTESLRKLERETGVQAVNSYSGLCEHILEMD